MHLRGKAMHAAKFAFANFATTSNCNFSHELARTPSSS